MRLLLLLINVLKRICLILSGGLIEVRVLELGRRLVKITEVGLVKHTLISSGRCTEVVTTEGGRPVKFRLILVSVAKLQV